MEEVTSEVEDTSNAVSDHWRRLDWDRVMDDMLRLMLSSYHEGGDDNTGLSTFHHADRGMGYRWWAM